MENKIYKNAPSKFETLVCENAHLVVTPNSGIELPTLTKYENGGVDTFPDYDDKFKCWAIVTRNFRNCNGSIIGAIDYVRKHIAYNSAYSDINFRPYDDVISCRIYNMFYECWNNERPNLTKLFEIIHECVGENINRKEFDKIVKQVKAKMPKWCRKHVIYGQISKHCIHYAEEKERPLVEQTIQEIKAKHNLNEIQEPYWNLEKKIKGYKWAV